MWNNNCPEFLKWKCQEFSKFEFGQYHSNWSSQHFLGHLFASGKKIIKWLIKREILGFNERAFRSIIVDSSGGAISERVCCSRWKVFIYLCSKWKDFSTAIVTESRMTRNLKIFNIIQLFQSRCPVKYRFFVIIIIIWVLSNILIATSCCDIASFDRKKQH